jgi:uncharacterized SAM-binding protein YcdF (DUF218 family)
MRQSFLLSVAPIHSSNVMMKTLLLLLLAAVLGVGVFHVRELFRKAWPSLLVVHAPLAKADAIIVLGGESFGRPLEAARLYREGVAPRIFITGVGDAGRNRQVLISQGVPPSAITMESKSNTTYTNATLLRPMLEDAKVQSALIVTSPFHTRRALATFRHVMGGISFGVTSPSMDSWQHPQTRYNPDRIVAVEFLKTIKYWVIDGVSPFYRVQ